ncbi:hypothetical protein [Streptomyces melanogenes]|uniref:hypothetical protein n=1 Tax=Streptomyces melanogenes TaxID=67326 RepID=UPI00167EA79A|nr:hypothetical protein [Streptomyces melanogenes]
MNAPPHTTFGYSEPPPDAELLPAPGPTADRAEAPAGEEPQPESLLTGWARPTQPGDFPLGYWGDGKHTA